MMLGLRRINENLWNLANFCSSLETATLIKTCFLIVKKLVCTANRGRSRGNLSNVVSS